MYTIMYMKYIVNYIKFINQHLVLLVVKRRKRNLVAYGS